MTYVIRPKNGNGIYELPRFLLNRLLHEIKELSLDEEFSFPSLPVPVQEIEINGVSYLELTLTKYGHHGIDYEEGLTNFKTLLCCLLPSYHHCHNKLPKVIPTELLRIIQTFLCPPKTLKMKAKVHLSREYPFGPPIIYITEHNLGRHPKCLEENGCYTLAKRDWAPGMSLSRTLRIIEAEMLDPGIIQLNYEVHRNLSVVVQSTLTVNPRTRTMKDLLRVI